jgi:S-DNA-T family DNA segregation ATPase FtsK/SpoIIIE
MAESRKPKAKNAPVTKTKTKNGTKRDSSITREIAAISFVSVGVSLGLAMFARGGGGVAGVFVSGVLRGLFGVGGYMAPFITAGLGVMVFLSKKRLRVKYALGALIFLCFITFLSIFNEEDPDLSGFFAYLSRYYNLGSAYNGGLIGLCLGRGLSIMFGEIGAYITLTTIIIISLILITGRSFFSFISFVSDKLLSYGYDDDIEYVEEDAPPSFSRTVEKSSERAPAIFTIQDGKKNIGEVMLISEAIKKRRGHKPAVKEVKSADITEVINLSPASIDESDDDITVRGVPDEEPPFKEEAYVGEAKTEKPDSVSDFTNEAAERTLAASSKPGEYSPPPITLLNVNPASASTGSRARILENSKKLENTLKSFGVEAKVIEVSKGPAVTRYELSPGHGVKVSKISSLADDLALNLAAIGVRIEAPIPGKAAVGIEIPNKEVTPVHLREVLEDDAFKNFPSRLAFGLGKDIAGNTIVADIARMPHLLIAGSTGSGKSVCINTLVTSLLYKSNPDEVKLLMVDPKVVELSVYNGIPHLIIPVVTDPKKAAGALNWGVQEMIRRYNLFAETGLRDLRGYNQRLKESGETDVLPQIVIIIDELADLMMAAPDEVEDAICRLAQMARAAGIHLIIATQRPSVDIITGLIKANIPSRLAFAVSSGTDSRTILDMTGAEKLLGKGDMLFYPVGMGKPVRLQGAFVSDKEIESIVGYIKNSYSVEYDKEMIDAITEAKVVNDDAEGEEDEFFEEAVEFLLRREKASASLLQRQFRIGYNRASRLIEYLEARGIVGPEDGSKPRKVLISSLEWENIKTRRI